MTDTEKLDPILLTKYRKEVIIFLSKRDLLSKLGGCGNIEMVYHQDKQEYANYSSPRCFTNIQHRSQPKLRLMRRRRNEYSHRG